MRDRFTPQYDTAPRETCYKCKVPAPRVRETPEKSAVCAHCNPEALDNRDTRTFTLANFAFGEIMRLSRLRDQWPGGDGA